MFFNLDKNSKDAFLKKLQICMKNYDYKDESRDVKGKVRYFNSFFIDWKTKCGLRIATNALRPKKCYIFDYP